MAGRSAGKIPKHRELVGDMITKYYDEILHFCVYNLHDTDAAYDITQETFLRFMKNAEGLEHKNLKGYLLAIARNLCVDHWKACKREKTADFTDGEESRPDAEYERAEDAMFLSALLSGLSPEQREVVILRYYNDLKLTEISNMLGVNLSTVKSRLRLGVRHLREQI